MKQSKLFTLMCQGCLLLAAGYGGLYWFEDKMLYGPDAGNFPRDPLAAITMPAFKKKIEEVYFNTPDGNRINAWFIPPQAGRPTIVFAHGNGGSMGDRWAWIMPFINGGYGFLAFDYRGYGKSSGNPSEAGLYQDFESAVQFLEKQKQIPVSDQIALGESLGGGVVIDAATRHEFKAVVVYSTFTSIPNMASHLLRENNLNALTILPFKDIVRQDFDSIRKIGLIKSPLIVAHSANDEFIPLKMGQQLYQKSTSPQKLFILDPNSGHSVEPSLLVGGIKKIIKPKN